MARTTTSAARTRKQAAKEPVESRATARKRRSRAGSMSEEHKQALAAGRREGAAVKAYLEALEVAKPRRGRRRSPDGIERRLTEIAGELPAATSLHRLLLIQERHDLESELGRLRNGGKVDLGGLEDAFVAHASSYSRRKRIDYESWRDVGVPHNVLKRAGIQRSAGKS